MCRKVVSGGPDSAPFDAGSGRKSDCSFEFIGRDAPSFDKAFSEGASTVGMNV